MADKKKAKEESAAGTGKAVVENSEIPPLADKYKSYARLRALMGQVDSAAGANIDGAGNPEAAKVGGSAEEKKKKEPLTLSAAAVRKTAAAICARRQKEEAAVDSDGDY